MVESRIIPNRHVFVSIFSCEIEEKCRSSQSGYCSSTITYFKKLLIHNENELKETLAESEIVPNQHVFISNFG